MVMILNEKLKSFYLDRKCCGEVNPCEAYNSDNGKCNIYNRPCDGCYQSSINMMETMGERDGY